MEDNNKNALYCSHCGVLIGEAEDYEEVNGEIVCTSCYNTCNGAWAEAFGDNRYHLGQRRL